MRLTYEENNREIDLAANSSATVLAALDGLHTKNRPYVHLSRENRDYIQCAGDSKLLTVEVRFYVEGSDKFKHYVVGHQQMSKAWTRIYGPLGPIAILQHEALILEEAREIFAEFYNTGGVPSKYLKRNITKMFIEPSGS